MANFQPDASFARDLDAADELREFRQEFHLPKDRAGKEWIYLCGNSLGLQPKSVRAAIEQELADWEKLGVEGHFRAKHPWMPYHERLTEKLARVVGARPIEVVAMNTLTANLHFMMVSFYRPSRERYKIVVENHPFPSDRYAVASQLQFHGFDPEKAMIELQPQAGEKCIRTEDVLKLLEQEGDSIALIMLGGANYYSGQVFDMAAITRAAQRRGCTVGFDLAHAAGNILLHLHDWNVDFAIWCSYKYLNAGPGSVAGCFVHERHAYDRELPRFAGWWGHNKQTRFKMPPGFDPIPGAEGWQVSNPAIFPLAALRASLDLFDDAGMTRLRQKSEKLTGYLEFLLHHHVPQQVEILTPANKDERGAQLSLHLEKDGHKIYQQLMEQQIICDWREPDVIRVAPVPLYNSFFDVFEFATALAKLMRKSGE